MIVEGLTNRPRPEPRESGFTQGYDEEHAFSTFIKLGVRTEASFRLSWLRSPFALLRDRLPRESLFAPKTLVRIRGRFP